ncbi:DEAD/DEAH box helicase [Pseudoalteromonas sp. Cnat2-41]|uniref:DEAD/DEAH box helicase n=1 Tax=unclassified Pseudoalteromonas TaxID=194690 RepID=UPI001EF7FAC3|nr:MULTISPECIES: DEAD/DEAH box helicase [unclassified Pseudoalteromonas]MCF2861768.1 DEAD/DEAH box helicase [Pseudoalteromonas sp. CNAT2-18]MCG7557193.1 DEAD/DEAH box helicase [Pseudoalteromonas sp. CNAT2-18.1]
MSSSYNAAISHPVFIEVFDNLLNKLFLKNREIDECDIDIPSTKIKKATWLASIGALGEEDKERNLASAFGALLHLSDPDNEAYIKACYIMQSRSGNIVSSMHLPKLFHDKKYKIDFGSLLNIELAGNRAELEQKFSDETEVYFTKFQAKLWDSLTSLKNVAISAPTSAGKSFIIKKYISEIVENSEKSIIYVVPTKALINQVSNDIKYLLGEKAHVFTTYREVEDSKPSIFVLTPERTLKIFQDSDFQVPRLVFLDEAHNIEDRSRGSVFENSLYRMVNKWPACQFVVAGPFIEQLSKSINSIADIELIDHKSFSSPVFQLKVALTLSPRNKKANYKIASPTGNILKGEIDLKSALYSKAKRNKGDALAAIMALFDPNDHNIIYSPTRYSSEKWAQKVAPVIGLNNPDIVEGADQKVKDLIEFLADEVHPKYSLIRTLRLGVAYHHAGLPDIARQEIEELYSKSLIKNIVCTSTLVQGVNLPADRLLVINPKVDSDEMSNFEFFNLIGRAGRVSTKLYGEVYCIDVEDDEWGEDRLTTEVKKSVSSATLTSINKYKDILPSTVSLSREELAEFEFEKDLYQLISYLRSLYQVDKSQLEKITSASELRNDQAKAIKNSLSELSEGLSIPSSLIEKNPFIDPILQNKFYQSVCTNGVGEWLIEKAPYEKNGQNTKEADFKDKSYYYQLWSVMDRLNTIFDIEGEINANIKNYDDYISLGLLVKDCHNWMTGKRHTYFVKEQLKGSSESEDNVDKAARYVTKHISRNITFIAVKYLMIWADIVSSFLTDDEKEENSYILNLPSMLEMGSYDPVVLELMTLGINRSIALKIKPLIKRQDNKSVEESLKSIDRNKLHPLFNRYLNRAGYGASRNITRASR